MSVEAWAPGRVNLIGEHTDYNGGLALPFAVARGVTVRARATGRDAVHVRALDLGAQDAFGLADPPPASGWRAFARGVAAELQAAGHRLVGAELEVQADLPRGGGLSSSAALSAALALALLAVAEAPEPDRRALAALCARVESRWVGAQTGLLDQLAVLLAQPGAALLVDFASGAVEPVALELAGWTLVTADSGATREHAGSGYNARRRECAAACVALGVGSLRGASADAVVGLPAPLDRRAAHVLGENARVLAAVQALRAGDLPGLGTLLDAAHASLRDLYEVSVPAVEATVARLREAGAAGARLMGGGFGGHVLGLLPPGVPVPPWAEAVVPGPGARVRRGPAPPR